MIARPLILAVLLVALLGVLPGCLQRRISITSDPPGALVTLNDTEIGVTPVDTSFTYYGTYDVRLEKPGYEPLRTHAAARAPLYEYPPVDFVAQAIPAKIEKTVRWHFTLTPALETSLATDQFERELQERAAVVRDRLDQK